ncbi:MAG: ATP-binding cassette domain-containing protein, partial [Pseudomonadota bacterium]
MDGAVLDSDVRTAASGQKSPTGDGVGLVADNLQKSFRRRQVVNHVSFRVCRGEAVGLLGPNGAGKTT